MSGRKMPMGDQAVPQWGSHPGIDIPDGEDPVLDEVIRLVDDVDITVTHDAELMVAGVKGDTARGTRFVDAWNQPEPFHVADSGWIVVHEADVERLTTTASRQGLNVVRRERV